MHTRTILAVAGLALLADLSRADAGFTLLEFGADFGTSTSAFAIAAQTGRIAGGCADHNGVGRGFSCSVFWDDLSYAQTATSYLSNERAFARAITPDGRYSVGHCGFDPVVGGVGPFLWDLQTQTAYPLASAGGGWLFDSAYAVSEDGSIIVGQDAGEAVMWSAGQRRVLASADPNSFGSAARGISADGAVIVGYRAPSSDRYEAFVWRQPGGMTLLPGLTPQCNFNQARGVSADGSVIVGYSGMVEDLGWLVRWTLDPSTGQYAVSRVGPIDATTLMDTYYAEACVSPDGSMIGGATSRSIEGGGLASDPVVWSASHGFLRIKDLIPGSVGLGDFVLECVTAISGDNHRIVGNGWHDNGGQYNQSRGWTLTLPCPSDFDGSGFVDTDDFDAFVHAFEAGASGADIDGSGFVDTDDFDSYVHAFEAGC